MIELLKFFSAFGLGSLFGWYITKRYYANVSNEELCPCGHIHKPSSNGNGLRTYCVEGSQCNSDKCKEFVKSQEDALLGADE